ncbi:MAG: DnaD domain protein, partial [Erysipelotrichaceae bacterium]|nr:DnaD domain protein [Erysipelotrichaceae bacterium]
KLVESLCRDYGLNHEVVNVLIEYTLQQTNQKFPKAYVEKIASSWVRLQIRDVDAALAQTKKQEESSSQTGSWYDDRQTQQADEELIRQAQQMQKKRKGD